MWKRRYFSVGKFCGGHQFFKLQARSSTDLEIEPWAIFRSAFGIVAIGDMTDIAKKCPDSPFAIFVGGAPKNLRRYIGAKRPC